MQLWWWGLLSISCLWHVPCYPSASAEYCWRSLTLLHDNRQTKVLRTHHSVSYLYARLPFLCVICDVKQVPEALVGDKLVVRWDNACVSPGCRIGLFLFSLQPPLLFQDFLQRKPDCTVPPDMSTHLYMWHIHHYTQDTHFSEQMLLVLISELWYSHLLVSLTPTQHFIRALPMCRWWVWNGNRKTGML